MKTPKPKSYGNMGASKAGVESGLSEASKFDPSKAGASHHKGNDLAKPADGVKRKMSS